MARCPPQLTSTEVARFGRDVDHIRLKRYSVSQDFQRYHVQTHGGEGLLGEPCSLAMQLSSELVHLGGRSGHPSRPRTEVGVNRNGSADREDAAKAVTVVGDAVTHGKHLVRGDRIAGGIEGTSGQTAPGRR